MPESLGNNSSPSLPLIIAGMHRSGTSMMASFLQSLGVDVGGDLLEADRNNQKGYFEDRDFVELHRAIFRAACPQEPGWVEVGWTESEQLDQTRIEAFTTEARALIAARNHLPVWGWKDPRTTLLLPFWHGLLPEARYVLVFRHPWDVIDSLFRVKHGVFDDRPEFALRIWSHYNHEMLAFYRAHRDRCVLINVHGLINQRERFVALLRDKLGLPLHHDASALAERFDGGLMKNLPIDHPVAVLTGAVSPETVALVEMLNAEADLPNLLADAPAEAPKIALARLHRALSRLGDEPELLRQQVAGLEEQLAYKGRVVDALHDSTSWKLTAPLRHCVEAWRRPPRQ